MSYPLIIFGAGASFDSLQSDKISYSTKQYLEPFKPQLTNDLLNRYYWETQINRWPSIENLATDAVGGIQIHGSLELYLTEILKNVMPQNEGRAIELIGLRFYLADLFKEISEKYFHPASYYLAIKNKLKDMSKGRGLIVNFNYDTLFEKFAFKPIYVDDYISGSIKVIKIHGACDWVHEPDLHQSWVIDITEGKKDSIDYYSTKANSYLTNKSLSKPVAQKIYNKNWQYTERFNGNVLKHYLPAVTIPLNVDKSFICPDSHINILKNELTDIDRVLLIGWRAEDPFLVDLLNNFKWERKIPFYIVSRDHESALKISKKFNNQSFNLEVCVSKGFSGFIGDIAFNNFWK